MTDNTTTDELFMDKVSGRVPPDTTATNQCEIWFCGAQIPPGETFVISYRTGRTCCADHGDPDEGDDGFLIDINTIRRRQRLITTGQIVDVAVRTTPRSDGGLIVRANDDLDLWFVLAVFGADETATLRGCILAADAKRDEWQHSNHPGCWLVPQSALKATNEVFEPVPRN